MKKRPEKPGDYDRLLAIAQEKYKKNLYDFAEDLLGFADMHEPLHRPICEWIRDWNAEKFVKLLLIPREHLKSSVGGIANVVCEYANHPSSRILYVHGQMRIGLGYANEIKERMDREEVKQMFPGVFWDDHQDSSMWRAESFKLPGSDSHTPSFTLTTENSNTTGQHYNLIILDDVVNKTSVTTKDKREKSILFFHSLIPQLLPGGKIVVLGTRWHHYDLYGYMLDPENELSNVIDSKVMDCGYPNRIIFPLTKNGKTGFTEESLRARKSAMTDYSWSCQYMNNPTPQETMRFPRTDILPFDFWPDERLPIPKDMAYDVWIAVDPNRSTKKENDPAVVMAAAVTEDGHYWVIDMMRGHPSWSMLVDWIEKMAIRWRPREVFVEDTAEQGQLKTALHEKMVASGFAYRVRMVSRGGAGRTGDDRLLTLEMPVRQRRIHIRTPFYETIVKELEQFPVGDHDDTIDCLADIFKLADPKTVKKRLNAPKTPFLLQQITEDMLDEQRAPGVRRIHFGGVRRS